MDNLSFDKLPEQVAKLTDEFHQLKILLTERQKKEKQKPQDKLLNVHQAAEFLSLTPPTIYSKVSRSELPVMKRGKRLYFSQKELLNYLHGGRQKTNAEIEAEAEEFLLNQKKRAER